MATYDPIPRAELEAVQLEFERHLASMMADCMAASPLTIEQIEDRAGKDRGFLPKFFIKLLRGETGTMKDEVQLMWAMGMKCRVSALQIGMPLGEPEEESDDD